MELKDSGDRTVFSTGAQRDLAEGKGRMDLLPFRALLEASKIFEAGAIKYEERNWEMGIPLSKFVDSAIRHFAKFMIGWRDENHLAQAVWNVICLLETQERIKEGLLPDELNDLPFNPLDIQDNPHNIQKTRETKNDNTA